MTYPTSPTSKAHAAPQCSNCGALLLARYCAECGQDSHVSMSVAHFFSEFIEGVTHFDSTFWRTFLPLLFKPGLLTEQFLIGKRKSYAPPLRSYLVLSLLYFILASVTMTVHTRISGSNGQELGANDCAQISERMQFIRRFIPDLEERCNRAMRDGGKALNSATVSLLPKVMFVVLPLVALFQFWLYRRERPYYVENLIFILHFQSFFFLVGSLALLLAQAGAWIFGIAAQTISIWFDVALYTWAAIYLYVAERRVYRAGVIRVILSSIALSVVYLLFWTLGTAFAGVWAFIHA